MYGFWRLGLSPFPSGGVICVANGVATTTSRKAKKTVTPAKTGVTHATRSRALRRVDEREVVPDERRREHDRRHQARREGGDQRVLRGEREPTAALPGGDRAGDERIERQPERGDERGAAQLGH